MALALAVVVVLVALALAVVVVLVVLVALAAVSVIEAWAVAHHQPTISEDAQRFNFAAGGQIVAGLSLLLGVVIGWFIAHFNDVPGR